MFDHCVLFRFFQQPSYWFIGKPSGLWIMHDKKEFTEVTDNLLKLSEALKEKDTQKYRQIFNESEIQIKNLMQKFNAFSGLCREPAQPCT